MSKTKTYNTAVVFADVAGSSKLYKEVGNDEANRRIGDVIQQVCDVTQQHNGVVIKTIGDEVMCHFTAADAACEAVISMQRVGAKTLPLRVGMAWGNVIEKKGDIFGEAVNDAAAVAKIARARQIITTQNLLEQLNVTNRLKLSQFDEVKLKGHQEPTKLYRVESESGLSTQGFAQQTDIMSAAGAIQIQLVVSYRRSDGSTDSITLTSENVPLHIGRDDTQCKLPMGSPSASRDHCHIDYQYGKFVLVDHSTNGTYVKNSGGQQIYLRRQETPLLGEGEISLGEMIGDNDEFILRFVG